MQHTSTKATSNPVEGSKSIKSLKPFNITHLETTISNATNEYEPTTMTIGLQTTSQELDSHSSKPIESYTEASWKCNGSTCTKVQGSAIDDDTTKPDDMLLNKSIVNLEQATGWVCNGTVCTDLGSTLESNAYQHGTHN